MEKQFVLPLIIMLLLLGCDAKKIVDESQYAESTSSDMIERAQKYMDSSNNKEALLQLYALSHQNLSPQQDRWVRDNIIAIYYANRDFAHIEKYLDDRMKLKIISASEKADNLFDKAEASHRMSYNHWARVIGMGSPYRRSRDAIRARTYYEEFLKKYPDHPKAPYVRSELALVDAYLKHYDDALQKYRQFRQKKHAPPHPSATTSVTPNL